MNFAKISGLLLDLGTTFVLLTRLPMPRLPDEAFARSAQAVWGYGFVGAVVGALGALCGLLAISSGLPPAVAAGLVLAVLLLSTGAMHEDGLADTVDGFWGGHSPDERLAIMKDSQIGSYGTLALVVVTGLRWSALTALVVAAPAAIIASAALSRGAMPLVMHLLRPARNNGLSQGVGQPSMPMTIAALAAGLFIAFFAIGAAAVASLLLCLGISAACIMMAKKKIAGQTGDVLGANQQLCETAVLCLLSAVLA